MGIKQLKEEYKEKHGNLKQLKAKFSMDQLRTLKRQWNLWKVHNKHHFIGEEEFERFKTFINNVHEIQLEKDSHNEKHTNLTIEGPFSDITNKDFNKRVL